MAELRDKKFFLLDMDGTIYLDNDVFDGTLDFLDRVRAIGGKYLFVTNNSSKSVDAYVNKLNKLGIEADESNFLTSTDATILYLEANYPGKRFYAMGTKSFIKQLKDAKIDVVTDLCNDIFGVIISNDNELDFKKLDDVCRLLTRGVSAYIATNPDWVCPVEFGYIPDCGSMCQSYERATGKKPIFIGKPQPTMIFEVMKKFGIKPEETVVIGDRCYTDIASGNNAGVDTVCVLSGEVTLEEVNEAQGVEKPTFLLNHVKEIQF